MLKELGRKFIAACILLSFAYVVYLETIGGASSPKATSQAGRVDLAAAEQLYAELGGRAGTTPVIMFVTSWCSVCTALEKQLRQSQVPFVSADVEKNRAAALMYQVIMRGRSGAVPVTLVASESFVGFQPQAILAAIKRHGSGPVVAI